MAMQAHLVAFEYGTGSVWGYVVAPSPTDIVDRMPEVDVYEVPPAWMTTDDIATLRSQALNLDRGHGLDDLVHRSLVAAA
jgi:hypothetical protein